MVQTAGERPLHTLASFLRRQVSGVVHTIHLLPFYPYSSDDGLVTEEAVASVRRWLEDVTAVDHNYQLALRHYSYQTLAEQLGKVLPR